MRCHAATASRGEQAQFSRAGAAEEFQHLAWPAAREPFFFRHGVSFFGSPEEP
jgi:hypothetical protein